MQVKLSRNEKYTITILIAITFWLTESLHVLEIATAIIGVLLTLPKVGVMKVERKFERCLLELNFICWSSNCIRKIINGKWCSAMDYAEVIFCNKIY